MKKLKEEYQPGGSKRQEILDKAVQVHTGSKVWNPEHEACIFAGTGWTVRVRVFNLPECS